MIAACPVCGAAAGTPFLRRDGTPVHQNLVMRDAASARAIARGALHLVACTRCGFVWNAAFDPSLLSYGDAYENAQTHSPTFAAYVDGLVAEVRRACGGRPARIVEAGCGQGAFLRALVEAAGPGSTGIGFDPSYTGPDVLLDGRLRFERRYYDDACAEVPADVIVCRHVIEHVPEPSRLLRTFRRALEGAPAGRVFIETPCIAWILEHDVVWDLFYEHCSYLSPGSLGGALRAAGLQVERLTHAFGGQYLWAEASAAAPVEAWQPGDVPAGAAAFGRREPAQVGRLRDRLRASVAAGRRTAFWGAGAKGVTFANLVDPEAALVAALIDVNPRKQGRFAPGTGHPIVAPGQLAGLDVQEVVLMNPNYRAEVAQVLQANGLAPVLRSLDDLLRPLE